MEKQRIKHDLVQMEWGNYYGREVIKNALKIVNDPDQAARKEASCCVRCYYVTQVGGAAMTTWYCGICGAKDMHGSTNTPCLCKACAKEHGLCFRCGADMELKNRRKQKWTITD